MRTTINHTKIISLKVALFFGNRRVCWATPGTDRHSSNFYGDTHECRFTRSELEQCIAMFFENYGDSAYDQESDEPQDMTIEQAIVEILNDMQFEKP